MLETPEAPNLAYPASEWETPSRRQRDEIGTASSTRLSEMEGTVQRLRRRLWIERGVATAAILGIAGAWLYPVLFPSVWVISVNGKPVVALRDKELAQSTLLRVKREAGVGPEAAFSQPVRVASGKPGTVELADAATAAKRLGEAVTLHAPRAVIYVQDLAVVSLPDEAAANEVLERLKQELSTGAGMKGLQSVDAPPTFKEQVTVRMEDAAQDTWADPDTALALLKGEEAEESGKAADRTHTVKNGDSAWSIAADAGTTVPELQALNPGSNLQRLRIGQQLVVKPDAAPEPPLVTVVAEGTETRQQPLPFAIELRKSPQMFAGKRIIKRAGLPGLQQVTYRVRTENGKPVQEEALSNKVLRPSRSQIVVMGAKPRPGG